MRTISLIARRDWVATILSPTGLMIVAIYLVLAGLVFGQMATARIAEASLSNLRFCFWLGIITVVAVPLITMRLLSEELRSGTFEVLTAHPVSDLQIVLGKFLAGYLAFLTLSMPTLCYVVILQVFGSPDWGQAMSFYLGQQLLALLLLAIGILTSSLTSNQVLAAMAGIVAGGFLWIASFTTQGARGWLNNAVSYLSTLEQFGHFRRGVFDTRAIAYFAVTSAMFLYLAVRAVESRRWKFGVLPGNAARWRYPRLSIVLLIVAGVVLSQALVSWTIQDVWETQNTLLVCLGLLIAGTPLYLNKARAQYELGRRKLGLILTVAVNSLLVVGTWALVTFLTSRHYARLDMTGTHYHALSEQTLKVLDTLPGPVEITVAMPRSSPLREDLHREIMDLLAGYRARSSRIILRDVDPVTDPGEIEKVRDRHKLSNVPSDEVIISIGEQFKRIPVNSMVRETRVIVDNHAVPVPVQFAGEADITAAIIQLTRKSPGRVVFLAGHAEHSIDDLSSQGASFVAALLKKNGWAVDKTVVSPGTKTPFPADTSVVVVARPRQALSDEDTKALEGVLDRGGGVLVLLEPRVKSGLDSLLLRWDVRLNEDIVLDPEDHVPTADPTYLRVTHFAEDHPIGKGMGGLAAVLPTARRVAFSIPASPQVFTKSFMQASGKSYATIVQPRDTPPDSKRRFPGPISLGIASERSQAFPEPGRDPLRGRMVVIGDADFITNQYQDMSGNLNLFLNCVDWLAGRQDLISVRPKTTRVPRLDLTARQANTLFLLSVLVVPAATMLLGIVAIRRRRYRA